MKPAHLRAQSALVRMIYDPRYATAVMAAPHQVLAALPEGLREELAAIDPRALRRDVHRRERTLGQLCAELPCASTLALAETQKMERLLAFYERAEFHEAIEDGVPLVFALAAYLESLLADGTLRTPHTAQVLALELASARARRGAPASKPLASGQVQRSPGVEPVEVAEGSLATLQLIEQHRFRLTLLPGWALTQDPPALPPLPALGPGRTTLVAVAIDGVVSLVEIDAALYAVLASLLAARARAAVVEEASLRLGGDRARAEAALASLIADELVLTS